MDTNPRKKENADLNRRIDKLEEDMGKIIKAIHERNLTSNQA
jgi:hypothetical protein